MVILAPKKFFREEVEEDDLTIYSRDVRDSLLEDDELSPMEEAFMNGYDAAVW